MRNIFIGLLGFMALVCSCASKKAVNMGAAKRPGISFIFNGTQRPDSVILRVAGVPADTSSLFLNDYVGILQNGRRVAVAVAGDTVSVGAEAVPSAFMVQFDYYSAPTLYIRPGEHIDMVVSSISPMEYEISGTPLYDEELPYADEADDFRDKTFRFARSKWTDVQYDSITAAHRRFLRKMVTERPASERVVYHLFCIEDEFVPEAFECLAPEAANTLYYPALCAKRKSVLRTMALRQMMDNIVENGLPCIDFNLPDSTGTQFTLSSLRGKWVLLDFWTTWCGPCRRGFATMKEIYGRYSDRMEIVAVACGDHEAEWKRVVEDYELPWVNLLAANGPDGTVAGYPVRSYPTKIIIDPDGNVRDMHIGEDEEFYSTLEDLLNE